MKVITKKSTDSTQSTVGYENIKALKNLKVDIKRAWDHLSKKDIDLLLEMLQNARLFIKIKRKGFIVIKNKTKKKKCLLKFTNQLLKKLRKDLLMLAKYFSSADEALLLELFRLGQNFIKSKTPRYYKKIVIVSMSNKPSAETVAKIIYELEIIVQYIFLSKYKTIKNYNLLKAIENSESTLFLIGALPHNIVGGSNVVAKIEGMRYHNALVLRNKSDSLRLTKSSLQEALALYI